MKALKTTIVSSVISIALFGGFSLFLYFRDWFRMALVSSLGLFVGILAAPEIEPRAFKKAWMFQLISGAVGGAIIGALLDLGVIQIAMAAFVGAVLGWSASIWVKHVPIP